MTEILLGNFCNQLNLHTSPQRNLRHAERAAGVPAGVAEHFAQQFAAAKRLNLTVLRPDPVVCSATGCYTLKEIAQAFEIHYATVSRIVKKGGIKKV